MEIFGNILAHTRCQDVKLQKMQKFFLKSAYFIVKILENIPASSSSSNSNSSSSSSSSSTSSSSNKSDQVLINEIKELTSDALPVLNQSTHDLLQQRQDGITKNSSREYKTLKHNVSPDSKLLFGDDLNNRIKLLEASNKACKINITQNNNRYYQNYSPNFS